MISYATIPRMPLEARIAEALRLRGIPFHKCCRTAAENTDCTDMTGNTGGLCLAAQPDGSVVVTWRPQRRLRYTEGRRAYVHARTTMTAALDALLTESGVLTGPGPAGTIRAYPEPEIPCPAPTKS